MPVRILYNYDRKLYSSVMHMYTVIYVTLQLYACEEATTMDYTKCLITRRMQGIVGASGKFILFLSSMVLFFIIIKNIHAHMRTIAIRI